MFCRGKILRREEGVYILLVLIVSIVYLPVLQNDFLYAWDDQWVVINTYTSNGLSLDNLWNILTEFYHGQYAPLNEMNYLLLHSIWGYSPFPFHLSSLCWHLANVCLVYLFLKKLLILRYGKNSIKIRNLSFLTALIWGVHPVNVESVAWLSASKVLIYSFFYLLSLLCYLKYLTSKKSFYFALTIISFFLSFLGKEQAVTLPLALLLVDYFTNRDFKDKNLWLEKSSFFAMSLLGGLLTIYSQGSDRESIDFAYSFGERILFACYTLFEYFVKAFFPINLSYLYPFPILPGEDIPLRFWFYPLVILCGMYIVFYLRKNKALLFSILFFIIHIAVALHILSLSRFAIVADRYLYLGCIGISFLTSWLLNSAKWELKPFAYKIILLLFFCYFTYLGAYCHLYSKKWKDTDTLKFHLRELLKNREEKSPIRNYKKDFYSYFPNQGIYGVLKKPPYT